MELQGKKWQESTNHTTKYNLHENLNAIIELKSKFIYELKFKTI